MIRRLEELGELEFGWDGDCAQPINKNVLNFTKEVLIQMIDYSHFSEKRGSVFPVQDGRVDIEYEGRLWITFDEEEVAIHFKVDDRIEQKIIEFVLPEERVKREASLGFAFKVVEEIKTILHSLHSEDN